ncbi:PIN domain-containing protein [Pontiellaceae bacterium B1224]|nr:PIN domain-containing protein [Pontiellaceae bacterium B1224]
MKNKSPLLDTNIIIDVLNGEETALSYIESLETVLVPAVAVFEILAGCYGERKGQKEQALRIFDGCEVVEFSLPDALIAAELLLRSSSKSKKKIIDYFIAGTASTNSLVVATRNPSDFKSVKAFAPYKLKSKR